MLYWYTLIFPLKFIGYVFVTVQHIILNFQVLVLSQKWVNHWLTVPLWTHYLPLKNLFFRLYWIFYASLFHLAWLILSWINHLNTTHWILIRLLQSPFNPILKFFSIFTTVLLHMLTLLVPLRLNEFQKSAFLVIYLWFHLFNFDS